MAGPRIRLNLSRLKIKTPDDILNEEQRRRRNELRKKFGKPGRRLRSSDVPESPKIRVSRRPSRYKDSDKRVIGFKANIRSRGSGSVPGRELYVSKTIRFGPKDKQNPVSFRSARLLKTRIAGELGRIYQGRIDLIDVKLNFMLSDRGKREVREEKEDRAVRKKELDRRRKRRKSRGKK